MGDSGRLDVLDVESDNNSEAFWAYDHPFFQEYENKQQEVNTLANTASSTPRTRSPLYELNRDKALTFYPLFIMLAAILVLSILCNGLVCFVYRCRSRRATSNFFVIFFAIFDMVGSLLVIPLEITALCLPYLFDLVPLCKIMGFVETWAVCAQCLTLICVAYDCYRRICRPDREFSVKKARVWCVLAVLLAVVVSIPALVVFGVQTVKTPMPGVLGSTCAIGDTTPLWLRILHNCCVLGTFTLGLCVMTVLYSLVGVAWCKQRQAEERGEKPSPAKREFPKKHRFVREDTSTSSVTNYSQEVSRLHSAISSSDPARVPLNKNSSTSSSGQQVKSGSLQAGSPGPVLAVMQLHVKNTRQAYIFTIISIVFVVAMLPLVVVTVLCASTTVFKHFSSSTTEVIFNLCTRSYLLNYLVKPAVYLVFNINFRKEVKLVLNTGWSICTFSQPPPEQTSSALHRSSTMGPTRSTSRTPIYRSSRHSS